MLVASLQHFISLSVRTAHPGMSGFYIFEAHHMTFRFGP